MIYPSDSAHRKLATDILVIGSAYAPKLGSLRHPFRISLSVGRAQKISRCSVIAAGPTVRFSRVSMSQPLAPVQGALLLGALSEVRPLPERS